MAERKHAASKQQKQLEEAEWYDRTTDWSARVAREIPVLMDVFGAPGKGGILDAGCGTGHQAACMARMGYRVVGGDASEEMLTIARRVALDTGVKVQHIHAPFAHFASELGNSFDGVYCIGNSLAASGARDGVSTALKQFAECLRPGGKLFVQVLNFERMRDEKPCVRGPRVARGHGCEYVSMRHFVFEGDLLEVVNTTVWNDGGWKLRTQCRALYPVKLEELRTWCKSCGLRIDMEWGGYAREPFDPQTSDDLILIATRFSAGTKMRTVGRSATNRPIR